MEFSVQQALSLLITILITSILLVGMGTVFSIMGTQGEKTTVTESKLPKQDINQSIIGSDAPTLILKKNIKITTDKFDGCSSLDSKLQIIKNNSNCSAVDYEGNSISSDEIKLELDNDDTPTLNRYIQKGGVIRVKYSVEDSKGRKTSIIKNIILNLPTGGVI